MRKQFEINLTGPDGKIDGIAQQLSDDRSVWEFKSIAGDLQLVIAKDETGNWERISGTEPYLSSWIDELADQVA